jgi:hypothetical protein
MSIDSKFGFIALLDALGTRTATIDNSKRYLSAVESLKDSIKETTHITVQDVKEEDLRLSFADLKPRFFGDSILLSYEVNNREKFDEYLHRIVFVLSAFIPLALSHGIPVRGALAIGEYIEKSDVVLGPAVYDAANWYEQQDMISVMTTPKAANYIQGILYNSKIDLMRQMEAYGLILYDIPIKNGKISSYVVDWREMMSVHFDEGKDALSSYYGALNDFEMPFGTESKYMNTEKLLKYSLELYSKGAEGNR